MANYGLPEEVLTDQGPQYSTWRGKSAFTKLLERRGVKHLLARPQQPQTLGKIERFWETLWRECLREAVVPGPRGRAGADRALFDHYNFHAAAPGDWTGWCRRTASSRRRRR